MKDPREVVKAGDIVKVKVMEVDIPRKRIGLSMRMDDQPGRTTSQPGAQTGTLAAVPGVNLRPARVHLKVPCRRSGPAMASARKNGR